MPLQHRPSAPLFLQPPPAPSRRRIEHTRERNDIDDFLSSDLELSFANTSLNSPPQETIALTPDDENAPVPMDISPISPVHLRPAFPTRPRAFTSGARLFGGDRSNGFDKTPSVADTTTSNSIKSKRTQRAALPTEWLTGSSTNVSSKENTFTPNTPAADAMDVDTSYELIAPPQPAAFFAPGPRSAAPTATAFNNLFYDPISPSRQGSPPSRKRRSTSPDRASARDRKKSVSPSPTRSPSPPQGRNRHQRLGSGSYAGRIAKPTLQGLGAPSANTLKRQRRPVLSAMVPPSNTRSAYPIMDGNASSSEAPIIDELPAPRRAFSALIPSTSLNNPSSDESFDSMDSSSPAQAYAKRQKVKTIRRCDGTEDFRPLTGASAMVKMESPITKMLSPGMPGFGDNEMAGKILPCKRVSDDGLMRISVQTLNDLLDGAYDSQIADYHVIDCRFDYEYNGGHIEGAVNINTTVDIEKMLLGPSLCKPKPAVSGDSVRKTILVFHCEFSVKRAPTFAKHLRARDRAANNHNYPKVHYPELYILEGGYCAFYKTSMLRCHPRGYVLMDDPQHASARDEELGQFRKADKAKTKLPEKAKAEKAKFGRHKSYAYGDAMIAGSSSNGGSTRGVSQFKRNTAPSGGTGSLALFTAAGAAARSRRAGSVSSGLLCALTEDNVSTAEDTDTDIGDSPCPPPTKTMIFKNKATHHRSLSRAETYGPNRMPF
ncbi:hypothetical protein FISHEDRAFT_37680 [Fistulina hepatica ATCC 64428]|nr:hypothetical protein FISHEDRAFT_37680 [Fistulina hepatica ATCC 64428]